MARGADLEDRAVPRGDRRRGGLLRQRRRRGGRSDGARRRGAAAGAQARSAVRLWRRRPRRGRPAPRADAPPDHHVLARRRRQPARDPAPRQLRPRRGLRRGWQRWLGLGLSASQMYSVSSIYDVKKQKKTKKRN